MNPIRPVVLLAAGLAAAGLACQRNIPQASHSGKDKSYKGAKKIELEDAGGGALEGRTKGTVTYPGGDRVDWKFFEIPPEKKGEIEVTLRIRPPRPGLDLAFEVFDQYGRKQAAAKPTPGKNKKKKSATVKEAEGGKWYVQVYAPRRTDAADYRLSVTFTEAKAMVSKVDLDKLKGEIPDPPTLPAVVEPKKMTPEEKAKCQADFDKCDQERQKCEADNSSRAAGAPQAITARIINTQVDSSGMVIITMDKGKKDGLDRGWPGKVLQGGPGSNPVSGGDFSLIKVVDSNCVGKVRLTVNQVKNSYALLTPPAGAVAGPVSCKECTPCPP